MCRKLLILSVAVAVVSTASKSSAQYSYEVYEVYPQQFNQYYQQKTAPQARYTPRQTYSPQRQNSYYYNNARQTQTYQQRPQRRYSQNQSPNVVVSEAQWVCTNPKTKDMMIIATDDSPGPRNNGPSQWHQVYPQNNQANNVQPQPTFGQPNYPQVNPIYSTTEKAPGPVWPTNNNYQPNQPQINPTTETYTTTEKEPGPVWSSGDDATTKSPAYSTTARPIGPIWSNNNQNNNNQNNGFTVDDRPTTQRPFNPFFDPTTRKPKPTTSGDADDDGPIEIVMGK